MKVEHLRIGNIVYVLDEDFAKTSLKVDLNDMCNIDCDPELYEPIPLDAGWLIKLGFKKDGLGDMWIDLMTHYLVLKFVNGFYYPMYVQLPEMGCEEEQRVSLNRIKSVHELQNLYFVLTGEELLIKQPSKINKNDKRTKFKNSNGLANEF